MIVRKYHKFKMPAMLKKVKTSMFIW